MALMKKTNAGTLAAFTWGDRKSKEGGNGTSGITVGLYGKTPILSVECQGDELVLMLNDDAIAEGNFVVRHTDMSWQVKDDGEGL